MCVCVTLKQEKRSVRERKQPERVVAIAKQPRHDISRRRCFVTATTRSGT
jgi:biotin synthase-like enzyme